MAKEYWIETLTGTPDFMYETKLQIHLAPLNSFKGSDIVGYEGQMSTKNTVSIRPFY